MISISYKNKIRRILARVLLVIYSIILLVMYTHVHYSSDAGKCVSESSCVNHLYHSEYLSSHKAINHECFICKLLNLPYLFGSVCKHGDLTILKKMLIFAPCKENQ